MERLGQGAEVCNWWASRLPLADLTMPPSAFICAAFGGAWGLGEASRAWFASLAAPPPARRTLEIAWIGKQDIVGFKEGIVQGYLAKGKQQSFLRACTQVNLGVHIARAL